jgi:phospholipid-translocating ATPase
VSTGGLAREPSRGFDFNIEEGGVAVSHPFTLITPHTDVQIQRMQSRLSERSAQGHRSKRFLPVLSPVSKSDRKGSLSTTLSTPFGISRIRERAGSVFSRKKPDPSAPETPSKSQLKAEMREREWSRRNTAETASEGEGEGSQLGRSRSGNGDGTNDSRRTGEAGGMEKTGSKAGVGEEEDLRAPDMLGGPPEPPRV